MTFLSFKEIGQEVGISDHSNFSRNFKKRFGISHFVGRNRLPVNNVLFFPARSAGANSERNAWLGDLDITRRRQLALDSNLHGIPGNVVDVHAMSAQSR